MDELKPCPWCGPAKVTAGHTSGNLFRAGCEKCDIEWTRPTYAEAIAAWNRRADDAGKALREFVEAAKELRSYVRWKGNDLDLASPIVYRYDRAEYALSAPQTLRTEVTPSGEADRLRGGTPEITSPACLPSASDSAPREKSCDYCHYPAGKHGAWCKAAPPAKPGRKK